MSTQWQSPHRLHPFTSKDCAESVEQTRAEWVEVLPDPPSEGEWRLADFAAAVTFVVVVGSLFAGVL
jgi:hypothetical protein